MTLKSMPLEDLTEGQFFLAEDSAGKFRLFRLNRDGSAARYMAGEGELIIGPDHPDIRLHRKSEVIPVDLND